MWGDIATLVVSLLGIAASANWLVGRASRRARRLSTHAQLFATLPDGRGKRQLQEYLDEQVSRHVADMRLALPRRWLTIVAAGAILSLASAVAVLVGSIWRLVDSTGAPDWTQWAAIAGVPFMLAASGCTLLLIRVGERSLRNAKASTGIADPETASEEDQPD